MHLRRGSVHLGLVGALCLGSVPGAFLGVLVLRLFGRGESLQPGLLIALGVVLVVASAAMTIKAYLNLRARERHRSAGGEPVVPLSTITVRRLPPSSSGRWAGSWSA